MPSPSVDVNQAALIILLIAWAICWVMAFIAFGTFLYCGDGLLSVMWSATVFSTLCLIIGVLASGGVATVASIAPVLK